MKNLLTSLKRIIFFSFVLFTLFAGEGSGCGCGNESNSSSSFSSSSQESSSGRRSSSFDSSNKDHQGPKIDQKGIVKIQSESTNFQKSSEGNSLGISSFQEGDASENLQINSSSIESVQGQESDMKKMSFQI